MNPELGESGNMKPESTGFITIFKSFNFINEDLDINPLKIM